MAKKTGAELAGEKQATGTIIAAAIGAFTLLLVTIIGLIWSRPTNDIDRQDFSQNAEPGGQNIRIDDSSNNEITIIQGSVAPLKELQTKPPLPPPENIPSRESSGIPLLTDADRQSPSYMMSVVEILNNTELPIRVDYGIEPNAKSLPSSSMSTLNHIMTEEILPGESIEDEREFFGGPVHLYVFSDGQWYPSNKWFDMKIVAKRKLVVFKDKESFSFRLSFGTSQE